MEQKKLGFGFMRLPLLDKENLESIDFEQLNKMVDKFLEKGFTYFDTAYMYHNSKSEIALRETLVKRHDRNTFTVASKLPTMLLKAEEDLERIFNEQLEKCGVEYFDYYLLHNLGVTNYETAKKFDAFSFVLKKKAEGKIKKVGFSFHDTANLLDEILTANPEMEFVQLQINYLDWETESIQSRRCYEVAQKHNKPVIVMEPVKGGVLANVPEKAEKMLKEYAPDMSVAEEAAKTAEFFGSNVIRLYDVGVSGIHRLLSKLDIIQSANCVIAVAGMEGALAGVLGGLVNKPVIAVPTSIGYGANMKGLSALLTMINSCSNGIAVVNIDNGFGAGYIATQINRLGEGR